MRNKKKIIIAAIIILLVLFARIVITKTEKNREVSTHLKSYTISDEILKTTDSDVENWSVYEKMQNGLLPFNDSDTDRDGLTDQEEIEIYGSDPLKMSTSGDAIPDGYKVKHGYNVSSKFSDIDMSMIEKSGDLYNVPDNFVIKLIVENALARVEDYTYRINHTTPAKAYKISGLHDEVQVDFNEFMEEGKEYEVIYGSLLSDDWQTAKLDDGFASFTPTFENGYVALVEKEELEREEILVISLFSDWASAYAYINKGKLHFWTYESSEFYDDSGKQASLEEFIAKQVGVDSVVVHHRYIPSILYKFKKTVCEATLTRMSPYAACWAWKDVSVEQEMLDCLKHYRTYDVIQTDNFKLRWQDPESYSYDRYVTGFDIMKDAFTISNFGSYLFEGGNCAGLSRITCEVYNNGTVIPVDSGCWDHFDNGVDYVEYDLNPYATELGTFFDSGLIDYKRGEDTYYDDYTPEPGTADDEFIKLVGVEMTKYNKNIQDSWTVDKRHSSWESIVNLLNYFDKANPSTQGEKIAMASFSEVAIPHKEGDPNAAESTGHAVVIYGVEQTEDPDILELLVYDSNFSPADNQFSPDEYHQKFRIRVEKRYNSLGGESYDFLYKPFDEDITIKEYLYSNTYIPYGYMAVNLYLSDLDGNQF